MHPRIRKLIVNECLVWEADMSRPLPDFSKQQLTECILELWKLVKLKEKAGLSIPTSEKP